LRIDPAVAAVADEMIALRRDLHRQPETAFEERRTAEIVAATLARAGAEVSTGLAQTGVVGLLRDAGGPGPRVALRADMDALDIHERTGLGHASQIDGKMHACGHDGHTATLLAAALALGASRDFAGEVVFIFQPAEETHGGGRVMVEEGLFDRFPVDAVFGMHNWPGLAEGEAAIRAGPVMATSDIFEARFDGVGAHAAMPDQGVDALSAAAQFALAAPGVVRRVAPATEAAVVTVTQIHGGDAWNVIPDAAIVRGTARAFNHGTRERYAAELRRIAEGCAAAIGGEATLRYDFGYPPTVNDTAESAYAASAASAVVDRVHGDLPPSLGAEDFAYMLQKRPGCYIWLGAGDAPDTPRLHSPYFDFNDAILPIGASVWTSIVRSRAAA